MNIGHSFIWRFFQQYSVYFVKLLVQIVLARLLTPSEFGIIAIVFVFSSIAEIISVSGLGTALVQKLNPDEKDYSTVLTFSFIISLLIYLALFFTSPIIGYFYSNSELVPVLRVYCFVVFSQSYLALINAYVQKNFLFKKSFIGNLIAVITAGAVSIACAYYGFGVWALVIYGLASSFLSIICISILIHWYPRFGFSREKFKGLFSFSWKVLVSTLLGSLLENIYNLTIGRYYGDTTLGYYKQGNTYPDAILGQTRTAFDAVVLPVYSSMQNDKEKLKSAIKKLTHIITFLMFPMAFGLASIAQSFVVVFLTEKWLPSVYYLRLECIFYGTLPITSSLGNGIISIGRSDISAKIELSKLVSTIICVLVFHGLGVFFLCAARIVIAVLFIFIYAYIAHKIIDLSLIELFFSVLKPLLLSIVMGLSVFCVSLIGLGHGATLFFQVIVGFVVYYCGSFVFMREDIQTVKNIIFRKNN